MRLAQLATLCVLFFSVSTAQAARIEKAFGFGLTSFSGSESSFLSPELAPQISFAANLLYKRVNIVNHFEFAYLMGGKNFAGSQGAYTGYAGNYQLALKINLAKENVQPYIEIGPTLGMFVATLTSAASGVSKNQTAMKYGYTIGTGFDWIRSGQRGEGNGWGMGFSYFSYQKSPSVFEFPNGKLGAQGVKIEIRRLFGESR